MSVGSIMSSSWADNKPLSPVRMWQRDAFTNSKILCDVSEDVPSICAAMVNPASAKWFVAPTVNSKTRRKSCHSEMQKFLAPGQEDFGRHVLQGWEMSSYGKKTSSIPCPCRLLLMFSNVP